MCFWADFCQEVLQEVVRFARDASGVVRWTPHVARQAQWVSLSCDVLLSDVGRCVNCGCVMRCVEINTNSDTVCGVCVCVWCGVRECMCVRVSWTSSRC